MSHNNDHINTIKTILITAFENLSKTCRLNLGYEVILKKTATENILKDTNQIVFKKKYCVAIYILK